MHRIAALAVFAVLGLLPTVAHAAEGGCQLLRYASVDLSVNNTSHITVPLSVGGRDLTVAIDTGGLDSMLAQSLVDQLGLHPEKIDISIHIEMFGGRRIDQIVTAHDVAFGGLKASSMRFLIVPDDVLTGDIQGILGPDVLRSYDDDFDFANMKFSLFKSPGCDGSLVYWTTGGYSEIPFKLGEYDPHVRFPVTLDGQEINVLLDTGSDRTVFDLETAERLFGFGANDPRLTKVGPTAHGYSYKFPFKTLTFGGVTVQNPNIVLVSREDSHMWGSGDHGVIGIGILRQLHMYISYRRHILFVTAASAH